MDTDTPPYVPSAESQQALEQNVYVSAHHAAKQAQALERIDGHLAVIKWATVITAGALILLALR